MTQPAAWAVWGYRLSHRLWAANLRFAAMLVSRWTLVVTGADIDPRAQIGRRLSIRHPVGVVIGPSTRIGDDCIVLQGVTFGQRREEDAKIDGRINPAVGSRVQIGANAILLGAITVGDDASIGAGAVVLHDVPAGCTAVGNPARILPQKVQPSASPSEDV